MAWWHGIAWHRRKCERKLPARGRLVTPHVWTRRDAAAPRSAQARGIQQRPAFCKPVCRRWVGMQWDGVVIDGGPGPGGWVVAERCEGLAVILTGTSSPTSSLPQPRPTLDDTLGLYLVNKREVSYSVHREDRPCPQLLRRFLHQICVRELALVWLLLCRHLE